MGNGAFHPAQAIRLGRSRFGPYAPVDPFRVGEMGFQPFQRTVCRWTFFALRNGPQPAHFIGFALAQSLIEGPTLR